MEVGVHKSKWVFSVFLHKYVLNDYMKHIVETTLQLNGQTILPKISEILT